MPLETLSEFPRAKRPHHLPVVLTQVEAAMVLDRMEGTPALMASLLRIFMNDGLARRAHRRFSRRHLRQVVFTRLRKLEAYAEALGRAPKEGAP